jgi:hypothetical protein
MIQKKLMENMISEYAVDIKRKEMREKRSEDLVQSYLKAMNIRVSANGFSFEKIFIKCLNFNLSRSFKNHLQFGMAWF